MCIIFLTIAFGLAFDRFLVLVDFIVCDLVEWVLGVRGFVDGRVVLEAPLNDSLGGGTQ